MGQPRKEVGPGQRAGIGVGEVDLELRHHHKQHRGRHHPGRVGKYIGEAGQVHLRRLHRPVRRKLILKHQKGQKCTTKHLEHAQHNPARPRHQHGGPPAFAVGMGLFRQETQEVDLFANLHHQRERHRRRCTKHERVELAAARRPARKASEIKKSLRVFPEHREVGQEQQHAPQRLGPHLQARDQRDAANHHGNDDHGADHVTPGNRDVEVHLQRQRHDGRLQREEDEGEARVDQRGDGRAQVTEPGAARQQVHVHAITRRVITDGQAGEKGDEADHQDGPQRIGEAVVQRDRAANRLQRKKGHRAEGGVAHAPFRPLAKAARRVAQRVVLDGFVSHPGVVLAADAEYFLCSDGQDGLRRTAGVPPRQVRKKCARDLPTRARPATTLIDV